MEKKKRNTIFGTDITFQNNVKKYYNPGMGTENMSNILFSLIKFLRPRVILEFGAGLSSFFIVEALKQIQSEIPTELNYINENKHSLINLNQTWFKNKYNPVFHIVDNFSKESPNYQNFVNDIENSNYKKYVERK